MKSIWTKEKMQKYCDENNTEYTVLDEYMPQIFSLELPVEEGMKTITEKINATLQ